MEFGKYSKTAALLLEQEPDKLDAVINATLAGPLVPRKYRKKIVSVKGLDLRICGHFWCDKVGTDVCYESGIVGVEVSFEEVEELI